MLALLVAGKIVFGLPFHTARFFRPTLPGEALAGETGELEINQGVFRSV
jgi:acyl dehydratase